MRQLTLATLGAGGLAVILAGIGLFVAMNMDYALARYPNSQHLGEEHFDAVSVDIGHIGEASTYRANDDLAHVWRWYGKHFELESQDDGYRNVRTGCVMLSKTQQRIFIRRTVNVMLCPSSHRTLVYVRQAIGLGR